MDIGLILEGEQYNSAVIELLIKTLAHQKATGALMIELLGKDEDDKKELAEILNKEVDDYAKTIFRNLYERRGSVNLDDIFKKE